MRTLVALSLMFTLAACGARQGLKPKSAATQPPKIVGRTPTATPDQLMTADDQARPKRSDELLLKSERRRDDPFDLPPKN